MSEEEKALTLVRMVEECKTIRATQVSLRAKARDIGIGLTRIGGVLGNALPERDVVSENASALVPLDEILFLIDEIRSTFERQTFLENELKAAGIRLTDDGMAR